MVIMKDTPLDEYQRILEYCMQHDFTLRFIETMPMGAPGQDGSDQYLSLKKVKQQLDRRFHNISAKPVIASGYRSMEPCISASARTIKRN